MSVVGRKWKFAIASGAGETAAFFWTDESPLPGADLLNGIYQMLIPLTVEPRKAWGGYYVFDMPKDVFRRKTDMPLTAPFGLVQRCIGSQPLSNGNELAPKVFAAPF